MGFAKDLKKLCAKAGDRAEEVVRKVAIELQTSMILKSPVDTGRFRANWQCGIGAVDQSVSFELSKGSRSKNKRSKIATSDAKGRTELKLEGWKPGQTIFLTNSLPYANRLENGYSDQAPAGMVRLTVQEYGTYLRKVARQIK